MSAFPANPSPPPTSDAQWVGWETLPPDMRVILSDYLVAGGQVEMPLGLWATPLALVRLPVAPLDDEDAPYPTPTAADDAGVDRGVAYALAMRGQPTPPIIVAHGRWLDGRHRVYAARQEGVEALLAFDLTALVPEAALANCFTLGMVAPEVAAAMASEPRRGRRPR